MHLSGFALKTKFEGCWIIRHITYILAAIASNAVKTCLVYLDLTASIRMEQSNQSGETSSNEKSNQSTTHTSFMICDILDSGPRHRSSTGDEATSEDQSLGSPRSPGSDRSESKERDGSVASDSETERTSQGEESVQQHVCVCVHACLRASCKKRFCMHATFERMSLCANYTWKCDH